MKADRRKIEIIMARQEKKRAELSIASSTMYNILAERDVKPHTLGKLARELGVDITEILKEEEAEAQRN